MGVSGSDTATESGAGGGEQEEVATYDGSSAAVGTFDRQIGSEHTECGRRELASQDERGGTGASGGTDGSVAARRAKEGSARATKAASKRAWSEEEDTMLRRERALVGANIWKPMEVLFEGRTGDQIRQWVGIS